MNEPTPANDLSAAESEPPVRVKRPTRALWIALVAIAVVAVIQAAIAGVHENRGPFFDEKRFELWANNLADHGFYGDLPDQFPAVEEFRSVGYSAYVPPGYPFFLIGLRALGGSGTTPIRTAQALLVGITVLAAGYTAFRLFGSIAAVLTEVILVATGVLATYAEFTLSEILATATLMGCIALLVIGSQRRSWRLVAGAGVLLGYSALTRPQAWLLPIPIGLFLFLGAGRRKVALVLAVAFVAASFLTIAPWTIRNELRLHAFVPVSTYTWINFWIVNNPKADGYFRHPEVFIGVEKVREIRSLPEVAQDSAWRRMAIDWVRAHPVAAMKGWIRNERIFLADTDALVPKWYGLHGFRPPRLDERYLLPFAILTIIAAFFVQRPWLEIGILAIVLLYFLAFFALFIPDPRFRISFLPVVTILAAGLPETMRRIFRRPLQEASA